MEKSVGGKSCREVLERRVVEKCWRRVLSVGKSVVEKCWRRVLWSSVGKECWRRVSAKLFVEKRSVEKCC